MGNNTTVIRLTYHSEPKQKCTDYIRAEFLIKTIPYSRIEDSDQNKESNKDRAAETCYSAEHTAPVLAERFIY